VNLFCEVLKNKEDPILQVLIKKAFRIELPLYPKGYPTVLDLDVIRSYNQKQDEISKLMMKRLEEIKDSPNASK
jgi:hypothetical protein